MADKFDETFGNSDVLTRILREAVRKAIERHAKLGENVVIWRDGKVQKLPAQKLLDHAAHDDAARPTTSN